MNALATTTYQGNASPHLVDVVVLAGGSSPGLSPLNRNERKVLVKLCNRPLIWFTLAPWVEAGFRRFFLCVHDDVDSLHKYLSKVFPDAEFFFVLVPSTLQDRPSTTCDALRYFVAYKEALRLGQVDQFGRATFALDSEDDEAAAAAASGHTSTTHHTANTDEATSSGPAGASRDALRLERRIMASLLRDVVVLSGDTLLSGIDVERFVNSFYSSMASASVLLYRPMEPSKSEANAKGGGNAEGKKKGGASKDAHKGGGGGASGAGAAAHPPPKPFTHTYVCAMYEEDDVITNMAAGDLDAFHNHYHGSANPSAGGGAGRAGAVTASSCHDDPAAAGLCTASSHTPHVAHRRLHFMKDEEKALGQPIPVSMGFSARRPHMTMEAHLVDPHVYVLRHWVLRYIVAISTPQQTSKARSGPSDAAAKRQDTADETSDSDEAGTSSSSSTASTESSSSSSSSDSSSDSSSSDDDDDELEDMSLQRTVLPRLIAHQHTLIDDANKVFKVPGQRIDFTIPQHWLHHGNLSVQLFNAARGQRLPEQGDNLRIFCTIFQDTPEAPCKAYRVNTIDNYRAVSEEILAAKCHALHLEHENELPPEEVLVTDVLQPQNQSAKLLSPPPASPQLTRGGSAVTAHASLGAEFPSAPHPFDHLSSFLLPTNPFTLKRRIRYKTLGVYITSSLLETAPSTTVRITRSIIGPNVKLGENVTIVDSIIMGAVEVGDGAKIMHSTLCTSAIVLPDRKVVNCVVGPMVEIDRDEEDDIIV